MSERAPTLDDAGLFLPSDMFPDVLTHRSLSAAAVPHRLPPDDLAYLRPAALSPDVELAQHLATALALRRRAAKPRREPHSFFEFGPDVRSPAPAPAPSLFSPRATGEVFCRGCLGSLERVERHVDVDPLYRLQLPARPLCAQAEEGGFPARARARVQAQTATMGQAGWNGSRDYGGTGVFLPRVANNNGDKRKTGMLQTDATREKQKQQQYQPQRGLPFGKQAVTNQRPSERGLPQEWSY